MPICPQCTCWLYENDQAKEWVKCNQGHHYPKGQVKNYETVLEKSRLFDRGSFRYEGDESDVSNDSGKPRRNWPL